MKRLNCPNCGKPTKWKGNPFRPFCSEKCKLADLSKWLNEEYKVEEEIVVQEETDSGS